MVEKANGFEGDLIVRAPDIVDRNARVVVDERGLLIDGRIISPKDGFIGAAIERIRDDGQCRLVLVYGDGLFSKITFLVSSASTGKAITWALGIDAEQRVTRVSFCRTGAFSSYYLRRSLFCLLTGLLIVFATLLNPLVWLGLFVAVLASYSFALQRVRKTTLTVGSDGVLREHFMRDRFVSHAEIARVKKQDGGLFLELRDGGALRLIRRRLAPGEQARSPHFDLFAELLSLQIQSALELRHELTRTAADDSFVVRRGRPSKKWIDELRNAPRTGNDYRTLPVGDENLSRLVPTHHVQTTRASAPRSRCARVMASRSFHACVLQRRRRHHPSSVERSRKSPTVRRISRSRDPSRNYADC